MIPTRVKPAPGEESVWSYPRPPIWEKTAKRIQVVFNKVTIADTRRAIRVLETSHPPVYYLPPDDIQMEYLIKSYGSSWCEWKGRGKYYTVKVGTRIAENAAWYYPDPTPDFRQIRNYLAFYAGQMDACYVAGELVTPQPGNFYGGWITRDIVGPFKGGPNTRGW